MNFFVRKFLIFFFQFLLLFIWYAFYDVYETVIKYEKSVFEGRGYKKNLNWRGLLLEVGGMGGGQGCLKRGGWLFFGGGGTFQRKYEIQLNLQITWIKTVWNNAIWDVMLVNTSCVSQAF